MGVNRQIFVVAVIASLTACGGGGGGTLAPPAQLSNGGASLGSGANIPAQYVLTDLGTQNNGSPGLVPSALNNAGVVVGTASVGILSSLPSCKNCGPPQGWVFKNGKLTTLPPLGADTVTFGDDINNSGTISGGSFSVAETAVLWSPSFAITNLGTGFTSPSSSAEATTISDSGIVYGVSYNNTVENPAKFDGKGGSTNPCGTIQGYFNETNNAGLGVGAELLSTGGQAAILCPPLNVIVTPPSGTISFASDINNSGVVVGRLNTGSTNASFHPYVYQNGKVTDLGTPLFPGNSKAVGAAFGINNAGTIVGWSAAGGGVIANPPIPPDDPRATIYSDGTTVDLNTRLPANCAQWRLVTAYRINDSGQIIGAAFVGGYPNGVEHAYLLTPEK